MNMRSASMRDQRRQHPDEAKKWALLPAFSYRPSPFLLAMRDHRDDGEWWEKEPPR